MRLSDLQFSLRRSMVFLIPVFAMAAGFGLILHHQEKRRMVESEKHHTNEFLHGNSISNLKSIEFEYHYQTGGIGSYHTGRFILDNPEAIKYLENTKFQDSASDYPSDFHSFKKYLAHLLFEDGTRVSVTYGLVDEHGHILIFYTYDDIDIGSFFHSHLIDPVPSSLISCHKSLKSRVFPAESGPPR
jgi:hypothetical protein